MRCFLQKSAKIAFTISLPLSLTNVFGGVGKGVFFNSEMTFLNAFNVSSFDFVLIGIEYPNFENMSIHWKRYL